LGNICDLSQVLERGQPSWTWVNRGGTLRLGLVGMTHVLPGRTSKYEKEKKKERLLREHELHVVGIIHSIQAPSL